MAKARDDRAGWDGAIGERLKRYRMHAGVSMETVGRACGVTFQKIQKRESGHNRLTVQDMVITANVLGIDPKVFYEGLNTGKEAPTLPDMSAQALKIGGMYERLEPGQKIVVSALVKLLQKDGADG